jgi:drug/metabolite transporter (DMT)-like permease
MDQPRRRLDTPAMAFLLFLCAVWGVGQVAVKIGNTGVSPLLGAALRSGGAAVLVWAWAAMRRERLLVRDGTLGWGAAIAGLFALEFVCIYTGLTLTTVSRATLFIYMAPFVVTIGAHWALPDEPLRATKVAGLACAFAGLVIAFADGLGLPTWRALGGDLLELGGAVFWGATTLAIKARGRGVSAARTLFYQLAGSAIVLLAVAAMTGQVIVSAPTPLVLGAIAYQTVIVAFLSYLAWFRLLARYPASELSAFSFWTPIFGVVASGVILGETITPAIGVAVVLIASGIYLVNRERGLSSILWPSGSRR